MALMYTNLFSCMLSHFSHVHLFANLGSIAYQAPLSMEFSRQEYWDGLPTPGDLPDPGIEPESPVPPALQADVLLLSHQGSTLIILNLLMYLVLYYT